MNFRFSYISLDGALQLLDTIKFLHNHQQLKVADLQWYSINNVINKHRDRPENIDFLQEVASDPIFFDRMFSSDVFATKADEEVWLRSRLASLQRDKTRSTIAIKEGKMRLAEVLTSIGGSKLDQARSILMEALAETGDSPARSLSIREKLLKVYQASRDDKSAILLCEEVISSHFDLKNPWQKGEISAWAEDLYRICLEESPNKGFLELCKVLIPSWNFESRDLRSIDNETLSSIDTLGL